MKEENRVTKEKSRLMKVITAIVLALIIILCALLLAFCGKKGPAGTGSGDENSTNAGGSVYETVAQAVEKTQKAKSYDVDIDTLLKTDLMGNLSEDSLDINIKATDFDTSKPKMSVTGKQIMQGYTVDQNVYYDGEWKYFDITENGGYKSQIAYEEFAKEVNAPETIIVALPESLFANAQSKKNDDGSLTVTLTVDEATVETLYKDKITEIVDDVVGDDLNQAVTKDATIVFTVGGGYIRQYKVSFVCEITAGNDKVTYDYSGAVNFAICDKDVTVTAPANLDQFYELDWG